MKKHFKLILSALCALVLFVANAPVLNAAENDSTHSGGNEQLYKYTITMHVVDWAEKYNGGTQTITVISKTPLYIYKVNTTDPATYLRFFNGDLVDFEKAVSAGGQAGSQNFSYLKDCSVSYLWTYANGETEMKSVFSGSSAITYQGKVRVTLSATCPIFTDEESLGNHLKTNSTDGWENYVPDKDWTYSGSITAFDSILPNTEDKSYSFCSDGRLAILHDNEYEYFLYGGTGSDIYQVTDDGLKKFASASNEQSFYNLFPMTKYNHYKSTIPIFRDREKLLNYIETGNFDGCINGNDLEFTGDVGFFLQKVAFHMDSDTLGGMYFTWSTEQDYGNAEVEIFGDYSVALGLSKMGIRADLTRCPYSDGTYKFTYGMMEETIVQTGRLEQKFLDKLAQTLIQPHYFYLRLVTEDGRMSGWVRVTAKPEAGSTSYGVDTGFIDTDGNFIPNNELQDSYTSVPDPWTGKHEYEDEDKEVNGAQSMLDALSKFTNIIGTLIKSIGNVPELVAKVFSFLPNIFFVLIGGSFTVVVILRILGR